MQSLTASSLSFPQHKAACCNFAAATCAGGLQAGLNTELQIQLERMQQQHSTALSSGQESSVKLLAELQAKQQECLAASADAEALRTQLHRLQSDLEDHERQQARQVVELQALSSSLTSRDDELQAIAAQLAEAQQALSSTRRQLADLEPRAKLAQDSALALEEQLQTTRSALVEAQHQVHMAGRRLQCLHVHCTHCPSHLAAIAQPCTA